jgi:hypothetical protein
MSDDYIGRFRKKVAGEVKASAQISDFIQQSTSKLDIYLNEATKAIPVVFINNDKERGNESILYSYHTDGIKVGDYINALGDDHLVYKEIKNVKRENFIDSFNIILCNVLFQFNNSQVKAYFKGSLRSAYSEEENLLDNFGVTSTAEAFIMVPTSVGIKPNKIITIDDKDWRTIFDDNTTNKGISYITLEQYFAPDLEKISVNETVVPTPQPDTSIYLIAGKEYTFDTENGYFVTDKKVNILNRTINAVTFTVPFGTEVITIQTKINIVTLIFFFF